MKKVAVAVVGVALAVVAALCVVPSARAAADRVAVLYAKGMTCGSCAGKITDALRPLRGVASVEADVTAGKVNVFYDSAQVQPQAVADAVSAAGYASTVAAVMSVEQYRALAGEGAQPATAGCACCNKGKGEVK